MKEWKVISNYENALPPKFSYRRYRSKSNFYALIIVAKNEGERLVRQLKNIEECVSNNVDVIIADGPSDDGSTAEGVMEAHNVHCVISVAEGGGLSAALQGSIKYALDEGYLGIIMMDGNEKDGVDAVPRFIEKMELGFDYIQGSRFMVEGRYDNTPLKRLILIKLIHAPLVSFLSRRWLTDTTNGFRAFRAKFLKNPDLAIFDPDFTAYELPYYLAWFACRKKFQVADRKSVV